MSNRLGCDLDSGPKQYRRSIGPKDNGPWGNFTTDAAHAPAHEIYHAAISRTFEVRRMNATSSLTAAGFASARNRTFDLRRHRSAWPVDVIALISPRVTRSARRHERARVCRDFGGGSRAEFSSKFTHGIALQRICIETLGCASVWLYAFSWSSSALVSFRSAVSKPSVNQS